MSERQPIVEHDGQPHYEDINTPVIFMLTAIAAIVTYALVAALTGLYFQLRDARLATVNADSVTMATEEIRKEKELLVTGNPEQSIKPIEAAMKDVVSEFGGTWEVSKPQHDHSDHGDDHSHADHGHEEGEAGHDQSTDSHGGEGGASESAETKTDGE